MLGAHMSSACLRREQRAVLRKMDDYSSCPLDCACDIFCAVIDRSYFRFFWASRTPLLWLFMGVLISLVELFLFYTFSQKSIFPM